ncbi:MAG TPA: nitrilase-related carbon-nitrogen hydrolase [Candidatus Eremiobacteraceae bacterium]|nr:nitrilase-related carbon-nitrogen hydrolase [Candidatus Eremiobacteraceae bacterium]
MQLRARPLVDAEIAMHDVLGGIATSAAHDAKIVVLPECSYPAYVLLKRSLPGGARASERALARVAQAAKRSSIDVCIGMALQANDGSIRNEAVYIDRTGRVVARYAKVFLWNFDRRWFAPGRAVDAFDTSYGRLGMMICADGRMPEIARSLARRGAWLILDPTAWVGTGADYARMANPQVEFMMRVRARENGVWIAAADKCGSEHEAVHYVGASMIVAPDGERIACASADRPALIAADVPIARAPKPFVVALTPSERRSLRSAYRAPRSKSAPRFRLGVLQGTLGKGRAVALAALRAQGADAVIEAARSAADARTALASIRALRVAVVDGTAMFAPEPARAAALRGADVIVWSKAPYRDDVRDTARTRALENRVFVVAALSRVGKGDATSLVADPDGRVIGEALAGKASGFVAQIDAGAASDKRVVPGSDALADRIPKAFALFDAKRGAS